MGDSKRDCEDEEEWAERERENERKRLVQRELPSDNLIQQ